MDQGNTSNTTTEYDPKAHIYLIFKYGRLVTSFVALFTNILVVITFCISWKYWRHSINILLLTLASVDIIGNGVSFVYFLTTPQTRCHILTILKHFCMSSVVLEDYLF